VPGRITGSFSVELHPLALVHVYIAPGIPQPFNGAQNKLIAWPSHTGELEVCDLAVFDSTSINRITARNNFIGFADTFL
jgi:hypothetical protein